MEIQIKPWIAAVVADSIIISADMIFNDGTITRIDGSNASEPALGAYHIYTICRRNRIVFQEAYIDSNQTVRGKLREFFGDVDYREHAFELNLSDMVQYFIKVHGNPIFHLSEDSSSIILENHNYTSVLPISGLTSQLKVKDVSIFDLEVLYIGQSQEKGAEYDTVERLRAHKKLNMAQSKKRMYQEILLLMFEIKSTSTWMFPRGEDKKKIGIRNFINELPEVTRHKYIVDLSEVALINYFQTKEYQKNFITLASTTQKVRRLRKSFMGDFYIMIDTSYFQAKTFSQEISASYEHRLNLNVANLRVTSGAPLDALKKTERS